MKKALLLIPAMITVLAGCNSPINSNKPKEVVELTTDNFSKYVATNSSSTITIDGNYQYILYYTHFIGADNCKFIDCSVTYTYWNSEVTPEVGTTVPLSLSGDGETEFACDVQRHGVFRIFYLMSVSGTVEVYW